MEPGGGTRDQRVSSNSMKNGRGDNPDALSDRNRLLGDNDQDSRDYNGHSGTNSQTKALDNGQPKSNINSNHIGSHLSNSNKNGGVANHANKEINSGIQDSLNKGGGAYHANHSNTQDTSHGRGGVYNGEQPSVNSNNETGGTNYANEQGHACANGVQNGGDLSPAHSNTNGTGEHFHREEHHINQKVSNMNKIITSFLAGGFAGAIAKSTVAPLDRTKINFQTSSMKFSFRKAIQFLAMTYKKEGIRTLWRGNSATMYRIVPYAAVQYTAHEQFKILLKQGVKRKHLPPVKRVLAGSLAGVTATSCTYPLDFARARMAITAKAKYRTLLDVFKTVIREEGWRVIWRGYSPTLMGSCIYSGLGFFTYETLKIAHAEYSEGIDPTPMERWLFGALAGIVGQCSSYPLDIVRRRMQTAGVTGHTADYTSVYRTAKYVYMNEGLKGGLYKGLSMNWVKGPIANGVSFMVFESVQRWLRQQSVFHIDDSD